MQFITKKAQYRINRIYNLVNTLNAEIEALEAKDRIIVEVLPTHSSRAMRLPKKVVLTLSKKIATSQFVI